MTINRAAIVVGVVVFVILLAFWVTCDGTPETKMDPKDQKAIDSLNKTAPGFEARADSLRTEVIHDTAQSAQFQEAARRSAARARDAERLADSLARVAEVSGDSADAWRAAYMARTAEAEDLRATVAEQDSALTREIRARQTLAELYGADTLRRVAVERLNAGLQRTIARLDVPCRIVGPIRCPSRTTSAIVAGALGALAGRKL